MGALSTTQSGNRPRPAAHTSLLGQDRRRAIHATRVPARPRENEDGSRPSRGGVKERTKRQRDSLPPEPSQTLGWSSASAGCQRVRSKRPQAAQTKTNHFRWTVMS